MANTKEPVKEPKSLDDKSEAELKREAKARLRRLDPAAKAAVIGDVLGQPVKDPLSGFVTFIRERAVVGLAIGFVIGSQLQLVIKQMIDSFINPLFGLIVPGKTLKDLTFTLGYGNHTAPIGWGALVYALLDFLFIVFVIYLVIHLLKLDKLDKKQ